MIELWAGAVRWTFCIYFAPIDLSRGGDSLGGGRKETFQYFCDGRGYSCIVIERRTVVKVSQGLKAFERQGSHPLADSECSYVLVKIKTK